MKKEILRGAAVLLILLLIYAVIMLAAPFIHNAVFYMSILFAVLAFIVAGAAAYAGFGKHEGVKSKFYGFPVVRIGAIYLVFQLAAGILFCALGMWVPVWIPVAIYILALGAAGIGLIGADAVVEEIHHMDQKLQKDVTLMRGLQSKVSQMKAQCEDPAAAKAVTELSDAIQYSDPVSSDAIRDAEADLSAAIDELQSAVVDGDSEIIIQLTRKAAALLSERNRLCKLNK